MGRDIVSGSAKSNHVPRVTVVSVVVRSFRRQKQTNKQTNKQTEVGEGMQPSRQNKNLER